MNKTVAFLSYFVRLLVFILISTGLHLLVLQLGIFSQAEVSHRQPSHGIGLVARPSQQFLAPPSVSPEVKELSLQPQPKRPVVAKPKPVQAKSVVSPKREIAEKKVAKRKVPETKPAVTLLDPVIEKPPVAESVPEAVVEKNELVVEDENVSPQNPISEPLPMAEESAAPQSAAASSASGADNIVVAPVVGSQSLPQKGFKEASPRYDLNPEPDYPEAARRRGQEGTVQLDVLVLADGRVGEVTLAHSSGYRNLDRAAIRAVRKWQFKPAWSFFGPVESRVIVPVDFVLNN